MCAAWGGTLRRLPAAAPSQRQRVGADASDRRVLHGLAVSGLSPDGETAASRGASDQAQAGATADAANGHRRAGAETAHDKTRGGSQDLPLPAAPSGDRAAEPCM